MRKKDDDFRNKKYWGGGEGYSSDALSALKSGKYREFSGNRQAQYHTSQEQTQQAKSLPVLQGVQVPTSTTSDWYSNFSTERARKKYETDVLEHVPTSKIEDSFKQYDEDMKNAEFIARTNGQSMPELKEAMNYMPSYTAMPEKERRAFYEQNKSDNPKPSTKRQNNVLAANVNKEKKSNRDTTYDKDFDEFHEYRIGSKLDVRDYDPVKDMDVEHWRNLKQEIMKKHKWSEQEFDKRWNEYYKERSQKEADAEVNDAIKFSQDHPVFGTLLQAAYTPQTWVEGGASAVLGASAKMGDITGYNPLAKYTPDSADNPLFTGTRVKEGVKQKVRDKIDSGAGRIAYEVGTGLGDMALSAPVPGGVMWMGATKGANAHMRALERGIDPESAAKTGASSALTSAIANKIGFDTAMGTTAKTALGTLAKAAAAEGLENVTEDVLDLANDFIINGDNSQTGQLYKYYRAQGLSEEQARTQVYKDTGVDIVKSFLSGAGMGGLMRLPDVTANNIIPSLKARKAAKITPTDVNNGANIPENLQTEVEKVPEATTEKLQTEVEKPTTTSAPEPTPKTHKIVNEINLTETSANDADGIAAKPPLKDGAPTQSSSNNNVTFDTQNVNNANPKDIADRYTELFDEAYKDKGYYDAEDLENIRTEVMSDIENGEDLTRHIEALEEIVEDTDVAGIAAHAQNLISELDAIQKGGITEPDVNTNRTANESRPANPRSTAEITPDNGNSVPHVDGTMPNDGRPKTSEYYNSTMRNTPTNAEMDDAEYGNRFNEDEYGYIPSSHAETDEKSYKFIQDAGGEEAAIKKLLNEEFEDDEKFDSIHIDAAEKLADKVERQAKELEAQGQDASEQWLLANRLHKKIRENATMFAKGLEILKKWKKTTPQGQVDYIVTEINKAVDNKKTKGYTKMVNKMADDVEDAIINGKDAKSIQDNVKKVFKKNRENSDYNTENYEQLVLDLIGGEDFGKRSPASIAEEASALIKRKMGVSTLTGKQERAMLDLFEQASRYEQNSRAYNECISRAMDILDSTLPSTVGDKIRSVMYDNMLASLRTMLTRNLGGNVLANAVETTSRPLQVLADVIASKKTGYRTRTLTGKSIVEGGKGFAKGVKDWALDVKEGLNTARSGQENLENVLRDVHKTFKTQSDNKFVKGANKFLGGYDRIVRKGMELGDRPVYEGRYAATKAELLDVVDKFGDEGLRKGLPNGKDISTDELIELIAVNEGLEAVLQNDSTMKEGAKALKKALAKTSEDIIGVDLATMSTVPFVEVPANMASRFFQFTPFGIAGNIIRSIREKAKYGAVNQRRMTGEAGRNALGTLMAGGAMGLAANGLISDPYSEDKDEKKLQQNNDYIEYALQTPGGERQIDLSDVPVLGPMLRYGKMQYDALQEGGVPGLIKNIPSAAGSASIDTLYQGLNKLTGSTQKYNTDSDLMGNAVNAIVSSVGSMANPALVRQTAQFLDEYKRDLGDYGTSEYNKNLILNGLPVLREMMLNPKIGTSGEPIKQNGGDMSFGKFFNTYIAPWKISSPKENMSEAQRFAEGIKEQTGGEVNPQSQVFGASDLKDIKGYNKENYTHDDLYKIDKELYTSNDKLATALVNDEWFKSLSPEKQGKYLDMLYSNNKAVIKEKFVRDGMTPEEIEKAGDDLYTAKDRLATILKSDNTNHRGMFEYFHNVDGIDNLEQKYGYKMDYDTYVKWNTEPDKMAMGGADKYAEVHDKAKELGMTVENYLKAESEYAGGAEQKYADKQAAIDLGFVNKDGNVNFNSYTDAVNTVGNDPRKLAFYKDYKSQKFDKGTNQKVPYVINSPLTDAEKAKLITNTTDPSKLNGAGIKGAYDVGGWDAVWLWRQAQYLADTQFGDGNGSVKKSEIQALLNAIYETDNPYMPNVPDHIYNYFATVPTKQW